MPSERAEGTPQAAALEWVDAVMERGDLAGAWSLTDPTLRLVLAQDWVWTHRHDPAIGHHQDWDAIAQGLATCPPTHPLWDRFSSEVVEVWQRIWRGFSGHAWDVREEPEVLGLDLEMVTFLETGGVDARGGAAARSTFARRFAMRHTEDGWLVASVNGDQLFQPGWPPTLDRQAGPP